MENLVISAEVMLPMLLYLGIGYVLKHFRVLEVAAVRTLNRLVYLVFLPILLFCKMYESDFSGTLDWKLLLFIVTVELISFGCYLIVSKLFEPSAPRRAVMIASMLKANTALFSLHIVSSLNGSTSDFGLICILLGVSIPLGNTLCVAVLQLPHQGERNRALHLLLDIVKTPMIIGIFVGLLLNLLRISLPGALLAPVTALGAIATPLAFLALGASLEFSGIAENRRAITGVLIGRLLLAPALWLGSAYLMGWRSAALVSFLALGVPSTGVSTLPLVQESGGDTRLSADLVLWTAIVSIFTIFGWILLCKSIGLF